VTTIDQRSTGEARHPALEEVAAFVDGRLGAEERRRMVEHLLHCDECQELITETVLLLREPAIHDEAPASGPADDEEETGEAPKASGRLLVPSPGRFRRALPLIAALAAAASIAVLVWTPAGERILGFGGRDVSVAVVTSVLPTDDPDLQRTLASGFDGHGWPAVRGDEALRTPALEATFQLGVRIAELDTALRSGDGDTARILTYRIETLLEGLDLTSLIGYYAGPGSIRDGLSSGIPATIPIRLNAEADDLLAPGPERDDPGFVNGTYFALGKWAAAAQLAAAVGELDWFGEPGPRRQLRRLRDAELPADLAMPLESVAKAVEAGPPATDLPRLRVALAELVTRGGGG